MVDSSSLPQQPHEVLIRGTLYDISKLKHPGGSVIKFLSGQGDATILFDQFHIKLPKAQRLLSKLPSRPAPPTHNVDAKEQARLEKLTHDFQQLNDEFIKEGLFDANIPHIIYRVLDLLLGHFVGLFILFKVPFLWPLGLIILGVVEGRCGWLMHEAGHYSVTGNPWVDIKLQEFLYGFGDGMSGAWWRVQHNKHHTAPQHEKRDADMETLPLVAFCKTIARRGKKSPLIRRWIGVQKYLFGPVTCSVIALYWQLYLHPRHMYRTKRYFEAFCTLLRWVTVGVVCYKLQLTFWQGLFGYLLSQAFGAAYIFITFALNHSHLPTLTRDEKMRHYVEYASIHTMNVAPSPFVNWFMGYLNYQIEHHLFPSMPQFRFVALSPRVKAMFEANGLEYVQMSYLEALAKTFANLGDVEADQLVDQLMSAVSSDSEREAMSSSSGDTLEDNGTRHTLLTLPGGVHSIGQQVSALATRLKLAQEQQLRRLLSQRSLGCAQPLDEVGFVTKTETLDDDDAVLLSTFSNSAMFERLCTHVARRKAQLASVTVEEALAEANPLFRVRYTTHTEVTPSTSSGQWYGTCPDPVWWDQVKRTAETQRQAPHSEPETVVSARAHRGGNKRARDDRRVSSASAGLVAQSARAWESHLSRELSKEGETVESFRQASNKTSYIDKARFRQQAELHEYQRELALQARARDLAEKRSARRGETLD